MYERVVDIPRLTATLPRDGPGHPVLADVDEAGLVLDVQEHRPAGGGRALAVGHDPGSPAVPDYQPPFPYGGRIRRAVVDVSGTPLEDLQAKIRMVLARQ